MSLNSNFINTEVLSIKEAESPSGAKKTTWETEEKSILVAIYQVDQFVSIDAYRNTETTHKGLTHCKDLKVGKNRLMQNGKKYKILGVDSKHRLAVLSLKEVELW